MASHTRVSHAGRSEAVSCLNCQISSLCLAWALSQEERAALSDIMRPLATLGKHDTLVAQGADSSRLFVVRSGSLKQITTTACDEVILTQFYLPGEVVGFDAIGEGGYPGSVIALETTAVCELSLERFDALCSQLPRLRHSLQRSLSQELQSERLRLHMLLRRTAEVRMACFLVAMSERMQRRGYSPLHFRLAMSRSDVGSYLGLTQETVGRTLAAYQSQALLALRGREFRLLDLPKLRQLAETNGRRHRRP